jgi:hypothetical protein
VMKAVLLNSADKIQDTGDGKYLGMTRTILEKNNRTWLDADAHQDAKIPLNMQMGAGQLHAFRAYQQFSPGQWGSDRPVPAIGWNYGALSTAAQMTRSQAQPNTQSRVLSTYRDYVLQKPLLQGSYAAVTLAWDRRVELIDRNRNGLFDAGETFHNRGLNNLDLYLMRAEETDIQKSVAASNSPIDSVEHIFHPVPTSGRYKIRVVFQQQVNEPIQPYGLAWWTAPIVPLKKHPKSTDLPIPATQPMTQSTRDTQWQSGINLLH